MRIQIPPLMADKLLPATHFPAPYQCVIFRNWGLVPEERIAKVLKTDIDTVRKSAVALGLPEYPVVLEKWLTKGYITIIHSNWHLLTYEELCVLLDWPLEKLAFTFREDDFLEVKLGNFKPAVLDCSYRPLTAREEEKTRTICKLVTEIVSGLPPVTAQPFDFQPLFRIHGQKPLVFKNPRFEERFVYSYCAVFGDTLADKSLLDSSFPDELLAAYAALGITGVWIQIVLYKIVPYPFDPNLSEGWEIRQEGMRYLTEKLKKYGLRLFLYFNEPRAMPISFFDRHPDLKGMTNAEGTYATLCVSRPEVQEYLRNSAAMIAQNVPLLGGVFTITASENLTNCYSHVPYGQESACPRCAGMGRAESYALVNRLVWEGMKSVSDTIRVIAWTWGWAPECAADVIERLPKEVSVMNVSEQAVEKRIGDTVTSVLDYSISVEGPGSYALNNWTCAHRSGHKAYAKIQTNNTWEIAIVPYIPVFEQIYRHMAKLSKAGEAKPDGLMLSWSLGGYPSVPLEIAAAFYEKSDRIPTLHEIYESVFPGADIEALENAVHEFSEAFDEYPFHLGTAYRGTQELAPANLLYEKPTGFQATMTGYPYDDLDGWRSIFPVKTYMGQLKKLSERWHKGLELLRPVCQSAAGAGRTDCGRKKPDGKASGGTDCGTQTPVLKELWDCAEICDCHFRSMYLQCLFVCLRDNRQEAAEDTLSIPEILQEEMEISMRTAAVQARNPAIGYEACNHYYYYRNALVEKVLACRLLKEKAERKGGL